MQSIDWIGNFAVVSKKNVTIKMCIRDSLSYHQSRHTFGTLMVSAGVPMESISKMMGHTNIRTTQGYAKVTDDKISEDMDKLMKRRKRIFNKSSLLGGL